MDKQRFHAHETVRMDALQGVRLATFSQRALGFVIDLVLAVIVWAPLEFLWRYYLLHEHDHIDLKFDFHEPGNLAAVVLYYAAANYLGNGRTIGKWAAGTRAVSLIHERMGLWQSLERALGYGAAVLELGLGFLQYFWSGNRQCAQDKLSETIVVDERRAPNDT